MKNFKLKIKDYVTKSSECVVCRSICWVFRLSRVLLLAPVVITKQAGGWHVRLSRPLCILNYLVSLFMFAVILASALCTSSKGNNIGSKSSPIEMFIFFSSFLATNVTVVVAVLGAPTRMRNNLNCLAQSNKVKNTIKPNHVIKISACVEIMVVFAIIYKVCTEMAINIYSDEMLLSVLLAISEVVMLFSSFQFILSVFEIYTALQSINHILEALSGDGLNCLFQFGNVLEDPNLKSTNQVVAHLSQMYNIINDTIEQLNDNFGLYILFQIAYCFTIIISSGFFMTEVFINQPVPVEVIALQVNAAIVCTFLLVSIIEPCDMTHNEMARTNLLVSKLSMKYRDPLTRMELDKFYQYIILYKVSYTPMGIFTLSRSLAGTIAVSVTTYLVIIIQFQMLNGVTEV